MKQSWKYLAVLVPLAGLAWWTSLVLMFNDPSWTLVMIEFRAFGFLLFGACLAATIVWATGKIGIWPALILLPLGFAGTLLPEVMFGIIAPLQSSSTQGAYLQQTAKKINYDIYTRNGVIPTEARLSTDGPQDNPSFKNPKTGTNNFGVQFEVNSDVLDWVHIYDKRLVPDTFGNCAPQDVRNYYDNSLRDLQKYGCIKLGSTPMGRVVYAIPGHFGDFAVDIENSRIVFSRCGEKGNPTFLDYTVNNTANPKPPTMSVEFMACVDSFKKVELSSIPFKDNEQQVHYIR